MIPPRPALSATTVLRPGLDPLPSCCSSCGSALLTADPPMGRSRYGALSCVACGSVLAYLGSSFALRPGRPPTRIAVAPVSVDEDAVSAAPGPGPADESWRLPGCATTCRRRSHDPYAHEQYARRQVYIAQRTRPRGSITVGPITVDFDLHRLIVDGESLHVTPQEFLLIARLARSVGTVVTQAELLDDVWGFDYALRPGGGVGSTTYADAHLLRVNFTRVRQRLGAARRLVRTVKGIGYILTDDLGEEQCDDTA